jgi:hypothetical protein
VKKAQAAKRKAQVAKAKISTTKPAATAPTTQQSQTSGTVTTGPLPTQGQRGYMPGLLPGTVANFDSRLPAGVAYSRHNPMSQGEANYIDDYISGRISDATSIGQWREGGGYRGQSSIAAQPSSITAKQPLSAPKNVKSLKGAGAVVSKKELANIMRAQNLTAQQVLERAGRRGVSLGAGVVNAANTGKLDRNLLLSNFAGQTSDFVQGMKGLTLSRGQQYSGTYEADGKQVPIVQARPGATGLTGYSRPTQAGTAGESSAVSGGKVQKLRAKLQKTKALIKSSQSELSARGL